MTAVPPGVRVARGVLALNKPAGITSFQAVREVRKLMRERRVGHAGTLDPTAAGMLPICVGQATRLVDYFHRQPKRYRCVIRLGERSTTLDTEGEVTRGGDAGGLEAAAVSAALAGFVGEIEQVPPMHSAVRRDGRHLYELAREGVEVDRTPRPVTIHAVRLLDFRPGAVAEAEVEVECGKGTYMRVLAADLGEQLGTGGLLGWLERTTYGALDLAGAVSLDRLEEMDEPRDALLPVETAVLFLPRVDLVPALVTQIRRGQAVWLPRAVQPRAAGTCRAHAPDGELVAIAELQGNLLRPTKVLADPDGR